MFFYKPGTILSPTPSCLLVARWQDERLVFNKEKRKYFVWYGGLATSQLQPVGADCFWYAIVSDLSFPQGNKE